MYVSGNAFVSQLAPDQFHEIIDIEETMDDYGVVHPESIYDAVERAADRYPNKRFIVHFVQPHMPFIATPDLVYRPRKGDSEKGYGGKRDPLHVHEALATGALSPEEWWRGYRENLLLAFEFALESAKTLGGKSVFSSDHGNMAGERSWPVPVRHYGHPRRLRAPGLVNVPWAVLAMGERRRWIDEGAKSESSLAYDEIDDRLTALGYKV